MCLMNSNFFATSVPHWYDDKPGRRAGRLRNRFCAVGDLPMPRKLLALILLANVLMTIPNAGSDARKLWAAGYDRPVGDPKQSRSAVLATHGIVSTSHPLAS